MKKTFSNQLLITTCSILTIAAFFTISEAIASPSSPPPTQTVDGVLHIGGEAQTKSGPLSINDTFTATTLNATQMNVGGNLCLSGNCQSSWPSPDYSIPDFQTVMNNGNLVSIPITYFSNITYTVNGQSRGFWPRPSYLGRSNAVHFFYPPNNCPHAVPPYDSQCDIDYEGTNTRICGFNTDIWGNLRAVAFCQPYIGTY